MSKATTPKFFMPGVNRHLRLLCLVVVGFALLVIPADAPGQLGSRGTQEWIERLETPERVSGLKIDQVLSRLKLKPGDTIADIGAGAGAFSLPFARAVGPSGRVYAVDIDSGLLEYIAQKSRQAKLQNIQPVKGEFSDPKLPARDVDLAFFHDVLHHVEERQAYLKALATYLKPSGRIALIEMNPDDPNSPHRRHGADMLLGKQQISQWMGESGFQPIEEFDLFGRAKWFIIFARR